MGQPTIDWRVSAGQQLEGVNGWMFATTLSGVFTNHSWRVPRQHSLEGYQLPVDGSPHTNGGLPADQQLEGDLPTVIGGRSTTNEWRVTNPYWMIPQPRAVDDSSTTGGRYCSSSRSSTLCHIPKMGYKFLLTKGRVTQARPKIAPQSCSILSNKSLLVFGGLLLYWYSVSAGYLTLSLRAAGEP